MADIVLAECSGQGWLVRGEQHIDDLLGNTLQDDVTIEVIACESKSAVNALWLQWNEDENLANMWMIHPAIVNRAKGTPAHSTIVFAPWSAQIDKEALRVIDVVARAAAEKPGARVVITRTEPAGGDPMAADLANLRSGLLEARLVAAGVAPDRFLREVRTAETPDAAESFVLLVR